MDIPFVVLNHGALNLRSHSIAVYLTNAFPSFHAVCSFWLMQIFDMVIIGLAGDACRFQTRWGGSKAQIAFFTFPEAEKIKMASKIPKIPSSPLPLSIHHLLLLATFGPPYFSIATTLLHRVPKDVSTTHRLELCLPHPHGHVQRGSRGILRLHVCSVGTETSRPMDEAFARSYLG